VVIKIYELAAMEVRPRRSANICGLKAHKGLFLCESRDITLVMCIRITDRAFCGCDDKPQATRE